MNEGWQMVANKGVAQTRRAARMVRLRTCDVMSVCSSVPMGAPWAACAGKHLLGMVHACMAGKVYKPMTGRLPPKNLGRCAPQKYIYGEL